MNKDQQQQIKIFLVGLHTTFTQEKIIQFFRGKYGNVSRCKLITKMNKKGELQNTGYGTLFVTNSSTYEQIISKGNFILEGRRFFSKPFMEGDNLQSFKNSIRKRRAFLHNIDPSIDNNKLREIMRGYAEIEDAYIIKRRGKSSDPSRPHFGFVMFKDVEDAKRLIKLKEIHYNGGRFYISHYKNEDERKKDQMTQDTFLKKNNAVKIVSGNLALDLGLNNFNQEIFKQKVINEFTDVYYNRFQHHCRTLREVAQAPVNSRMLRKDFYDHLYVNNLNGARMFKFRDFAHYGENIQLNGGGSQTRPQWGWDSSYGYY